MNAVNIIVSFGNDTSSVKGTLICVLTSDKKSEQRLGTSSDYYFGILAIGTSRLSKA